MSNGKKITVLILSILRRDSGNYAFLTASYDIHEECHWLFHLHDDFKTLVHLVYDPNCDLDLNVSNHLRLQFHEAVEAVYRYSDNPEMPTDIVANEMSVKAVHRKVEPPMGILRQVINMANRFDLSVWFPLIPHTNDMKHRIEDYEKKGRDTNRFKGTLLHGQNVFLVGSSGKKEKNKRNVIHIDLTFLIMFASNRRFASSNSRRCERHGRKHSG